MFQWVKFQIWLKKKYLPVSSYYYCSNLACMFSLLISYITCSFYLKNHVHGILHRCGLYLFLCIQQPSSFHLTYYFPNNWPFEKHSKPKKLHSVLNQNHIFIPRLLQRVRLARLWCNPQNMTGNSQKKSKIDCFNPLMDKDCYSSRLQFWCIGTWTAIAVGFFCCFFWLQRVEKTQIKSYRRM